MTIKEFYDYISNNYEQSRHEVLKNITYDSDLFDDAYNDTVVKVAKVIEAGKDIADIRYYFFISLKWNYINMQNRKRRQVSKTTDVMPDSVDEEYSEERYERVMELWDFISEKLEENFEPGEVDIYLIYYKLKCNGNSLSYKKLSEITGIPPVKDITNIIQRIKSYVRKNEEINELKKKLLC